MNKRNVDSSLQLKARRYLEYVNRQEKLANQKGEAILSSLSNSLRDEIIKNIYGRNFKRDIPFFAENFSENFIETLMLRAKEVSYAPEELIYHQNDLEDLCIYFIIKGKIEIYLDFRQKRVQMAYLGQGKSFGEKEFVVGNAREFCVRSLECTRLIYVKRRDFLEVLKVFPEDKERFLMIKDRIAMNIGNDLGEICYFCENKAHTINKCPSVSYHPQKQFVIGDWSQDIQQRRAKFRRKRVFKTCTLKRKKRTVDSAERLFEHGLSLENKRENYDAQTFVLDEEFEGRINEGFMCESRNESRWIQRVEIDRGKNFKCYFPSDNIDQIVMNMRNGYMPVRKLLNKNKKRLTLVKEFRKSTKMAKAGEIMKRGWLWIKRQWKFEKKG